MPTPARTSVRTYRDLSVWQRAMDLVVVAYQRSKQLPKDELYGLTSQMRRAATSIPANIAEGQGRRFTKEFLHFLGVARGSLLELETHVLVSHRLGFLNDSEVNECLGVAAEVSKMLSGLMRSLESRMPRGRQHPPLVTRH
jgi:four helix bundle protein